MLNSEQIKAVNHDLSPLYLNAGAGTGKTKTLLERFKFLSRHTNIKNILILTFNKSAVDDLKQKLNNDDARIMTFHGFSLMLLKQNQNFLQPFNYHDFRLINEYESRDIIRALLNQLRIEIVCGIDDVMAAISKIKRKIMINIKPRFKNFFQLYNQRLAQKQLMDFDDLMVYAYYLLKNNDFILHQCQSQFPYLLIDESQDIDYYQTEILKMLGVKSLLFMVGDEHQNIYSFRGTKNIYSQELKQLFKMQELKLTYNYRSSFQILKTANYLLPPTFHLQPILKTAGLVKCQLCLDEMQEVLFIVKEIKTLINQNQYQLKDIVILYRKKSLKKLLERILKKHNLFPLKVPKKNVYLPSSVDLPCKVQEHLNVLDNHFKEQININQDNFLTLTSIHQMKGLDSKIVFVIGCEQETFFDSFLGNVSYEEEKRLIYVATTRAKERLYFTHVLYRSLHAYEQKMTPLCFLKEMNLL